jgi:hypothetical protein
MTFITLSDRGGSPTGAASELMRKISPDLNVSLRSTSLLRPEQRRLVKMLQRTLEALHRLLAPPLIPQDKSARRFQEAWRVAGNELQGQLLRHHRVVGQAKNFLHVLAPVAVLEISYRRGSCSAILGTNAVPAGSHGRGPLRLPAASITAYVQSDCSQSYRRLIVFRAPAVGLSHLTSRFRMESNSRRRSRLDFG